MSQQDGRELVEWNIDDGGRFHLVWREQGGPEVSAPAQRGLGVRMIERALASNLGVAATIDFAPSGVVCHIDAPVLGA